MVSPTLSFLWHRTCTTSARRACSSTAGTRRRPAAPRCAPPRLRVRRARVRQLPVEREAPQGLERPLAEEAHGEGEVPLVEGEEAPGVELEGGVGGALRALPPALHASDERHGQGRGALEIADLCCGPAREGGGGESRQANLAGHRGAAQQPPGEKTRAKSGPACLGEDGLADSLLLLEAVRARPVVGVRDGLRAGGRSARP